jgi:hypothetical protein
MFSFFLRFDNVGGCPRKGFKKATLEKKHKKNNMKGILGTIIVDLGYRGYSWIVDG